MEYSIGGSVAYQHDAAGNIVGVDVTDPDGGRRSHRLDVGPMNQVQSIDYGERGTLAVRYDGMGRPVEFEIDDDAISVEYDDTGAVESLSSALGHEWSPDSAVRPLPSVVDPRAAALLREPASPWHPDYGTVVLDEVTFELALADVVERAVPGLASARALQGLAEELFDDDGRFDFEKPSNPVFQPLEYRYTNCCMPFAGETCGPDGPGFPGAPPVEGPPAEGPPACPHPAAGDLPRPTMLNIKQIPVEFPDHITVNDHNAWGTARVHFYADGLVCQEVCSAEQVVYQIGGSVPYDGALIRIAKLVPLAALCPDHGVRTRGEKARTKRHEDIHALGYTKRFNDVLTSTIVPELSTTYATMGDCMTGLDTLKAAVAGVRTVERPRQRQHCDHSSRERNRTAVCPMPGGPSDEIACDEYHCPGNVFLQRGPNCSG